MRVAGDIPEGTYYILKYITVYHYSFVRKLVQAGATHTRTNFSTTSSTKSVSLFLLVDSSKEQKFFSLHRGDKSLA
jgi:hypothetical protein